MNQMFAWAPKNVHMATKWLRHDLDLLIILHELRDISHRTRNGCIGKSIQTTDKNVFISLQMLRGQDGEIQEWGD